MKPLLIALLLIQALPLFAQIPVTDAAGIANSNLQHVESLAKQAEQISNQVEQIKKLKSANDALHLTNSILGKYGQGAAGELGGMENSLSSFGNLGEAQCLTDMTKKLKSATSTLSYNGGGAFGKSQFADAPMTQEQTARYGAMQNTYDNYKAEAETAKVNRAKLAEDYSKARNDAANATDEASRVSAEARAQAAKDAMEAEDANLSHAANAVQTTAAIQQSEDSKEIEAAKAKLNEQESQEIQKNFEERKKFDEALWKK
jgi:hypothetical protein